MRIGSNGSNDWELKLALMLKGLDEDGNSLDGSTPPGTQTGKGNATGGTARSFEETANALSENKNGRLGSMMNAKGAGSAGNKSDAEASREVKQSFGRKFAARAKSKESFHALMKETYGAGYDAGKAEEFRNRALAGDYEWLPSIEWKDGKTLNGANGAYEKDSGTIYLNEKFKQSPATAAEIYTEEVGHHLDTKLNATDTRGDEGEMFRRLMGGEQLSSAQKESIRNENDKGVIYVDGQAKEVEFWSLSGAIKSTYKSAKKGVSKAAGAVSSGVSKAAGAVADAASWTGDKVAKGAKAAWKGASFVGRGIANVTEGVLGAGVWALERTGIKALRGFFDILRGDFAKGFGNILGAHKNLLFLPYDAAKKGVEYIIEGVKKAANKIQRLMKEWIRETKEKITNWAKEKASDAVEWGKDYAKDEFGVDAEKEFADARARYEESQMTAEEKREWGREQIRRARADMPSS